MATLQVTGAVAGLDGKSNLRSDMLVAVIEAKVQRRRTITVIGVSVLWCSTGCGREALGLGSTTARCFLVWHSPPHPHPPSTIHNLLLRPQPQLLHSSPPAPHTTTGHCHHFILPLRHHCDHHDSHIRRQPCQFLIPGSSPFSQTPRCSNCSKPTASSNSSSILT